MQTEYFSKLTFQLQNQNTSIKRFAFISGQQSLNLSNCTPAQKEKIFPQNASIKVTSKHKTIHIGWLDCTVSIHFLS